VQYFESTDVKYKAFILGTKSMFKINCNHRIAVVVYTVEVWFVLVMQF